MKLCEIFRFEIVYQSRRASTWVYFAALLLVTLYVTSEVSTDYARDVGTFSNDPLIIWVMALLGSVIGLLVAAALAGDAAAGDVQARMDPLLYTTPVTKLAHLGGRFLAALSLYAFISSAVILGVLLPPVLTDSDLGGPFRPAAYLGAYFYLLLPNAFVATALLFSLAALSRRAFVSYFGVLLIAGASLFNWAFVAGTLGRWEVAKLLDPLGATVLAELWTIWTPTEKGTRLIALQGSLLSNRVLWSGIAVGVLALMHVRLQLAHHIAADWWRRHTRREARETQVGGVPLSVVPPRRQPTFDAATHVRQTRAIARDSFQAIVASWGGFALAAVPAIVIVNGTRIQHMGVPLIATAERMTALRGHSLIVWLLLILFAGELIWREREGRLSEITDAAPVPEWVSFLGKFTGLILVLVALQAVVMGAGVLTQVVLGYWDFEMGLYARVLFGLQLADYVLFALLALVIHSLVNHKYVGHLVIGIAYGFIMFGSALGLEHKLLLYGSDLGWTYSDMRGFEPFIGPWLWFTSYWASWGLLLALAATLFWVRGTNSGLRVRLAVARRRFTRGSARLAVATAGLILILGGFIFYNTNVLNAYQPSSDVAKWRAEYKRRYGRYRDIPQPQVTAVNLSVEIYPHHRKVKIEGTFTLVNRSGAPIDSVHVATPSAASVPSIDFDRPAKAVITDEEFRHRIYALEETLRPGESVRLRFAVRFEPRGFTNSGVDAAVVANGTSFRVEEWLPAIGYQPQRELRTAVERRAHGLAERLEMEPRHDLTRAMFETVVGTDEDQIAIAPGSLRRTWTSDGRRYFHYVTDAPIRDDYAFFSAAYAVRHARWNDVDIQVVHHPNHAWNVERMVRSIQASLEYYARAFGPYPHRVLRLVEHPGDNVLLHASPVNISYEEPFSLLNPEADRRSVDLPFAVVAHEVAHQWWGHTVIPARAEGAALLTESLAWYSALRLIEQTLGPKYVQRFLGLMREAYLLPQPRGNVPLLRADDWFLAYRKGPFAMWALREYIGAEQVDAVLRRLIERHSSGERPLPTSLDLYRELQAVTPESLHYLLVDLFEANTFWELATQRVTAKQTETGAWQVTLDVRARKVVVDEDGVETEVPMEDLIEVGVFTGAEDGARGDALYLQKHRVRSGEQRITVMVPGPPARAGIDPRSLLIDVDADDNIEEIARGGSVAARR
jgi:ABC-2 type transport system permease protein